MSVGARRERERERRASLILDAAEQVFLEKGFESATMDDVAGRAEYSKGTLYLYFKSKDELYVALVLRAIEGMPARYQALASEPGNGAETLRKLMRAYFEWAKAHSDHFCLGMSWLLFGFSISPDSRNFEEYRRVINEMYGVMMSVIERGIADGSIRRDVDPQSLAMQLWGSSVGLMLVSRSRDEVARRVNGAFDFDNLLPEFIEVVLRGIQPESAVACAQQEDEPA